MNTPQKKCYPTVSESDCEHMTPNQAFDTIKSILELHQNHFDKNTITPDFYASLRDKCNDFFVNSRGKYQISDFALDIGDWKAFFDLRCLRDVFHLEAVKVWENDTFGKYDRFSEEEFIEWYYEKLENATIHSKGITLFNDVTRIFDEI